MTTNHETSHAAAAATPPPSQSSQQPQQPQQPQLLSSVIAVRVRKRFSGVTVLENIDFDARGGEIHTLMGENGAGKSTLMKILAGVHRPDAGRVLLDGRAVTIA